MKKQSNEKVESILLNLLSILFFLGEFWLLLGLAWKISERGFNGAILYYGDYMVIFILAHLILTFLEVKRVWKNWSKKGINRRDLIIGSVLILATLLFGFSLYLWYDFQFSVYSEV